MNKTINQPTAVFGKVIERFTEEFYLLFRLGLRVYRGGCTAFKRRSCCGDFRPGPTRTDSDSWWISPPGVELISALLIGLGVLTRLGAGAGWW